MAYFDAASAEPLAPAARTALLEALDDGWADPVRLHREGRRASLLLEQARERMAGLLRCRTDEVAFTSSGTQAVHLAVLGAARARGHRGPGHIVVSAVEHSSVLNAAAFAEQSGSAVTITGVGADARVDVAEFAEAVRREKTALACLQSANQEVGTIQPAEEIAQECHEAEVPLFVDAAASAGRAALPAGWSLLAASGHKWGGPPGVGVLVVRKAVRWRSPLPGDGREAGRVAGFPNLPAIMAATTALETFDAGRDAADVELRGLTGQIRDALPHIVPDCVVYGDRTLSLPHIVAFSCLYIDGEALVIELAKAGYSVSSGSACASESQQPSHVLAAMGAITHGNVRVSLPRETTQEDVSGFLDVLPGIVGRLRATTGQQPGAGTGTAARPAAGDGVAAGRAAAPAAGARRSEGAGPAKE